jgi:hypothetical protein
MPFLNQMVYPTRQDMLNQVLPSFASILTKHIISGENS